MNLISKNVIHTVYGVGEVLSQTATMITVRFPSKETKFQYSNPDTFTKFLKAENPATQAAILEEIRQEKELAERMRAEEEARKKLRKNAVLRNSGKRTSVRVQPCPVSHGLPVKKSM